MPLKLFVVYFGTQNMNVIIFSLQQTNDLSYINIHAHRINLREQKFAFMIVLKCKILVKYLFYMMVYVSHMCNI